MKFCILYTKPDSDKPLLFFTRYQRIRNPAKHLQSYHIVSVPIPITFNSRGAAQQYGDNYFKRSIELGYVTKATVITADKALQILQEKYTWLENLPTDS